MIGEEKIDYYVDTDISNEEKIEEELEKVEVKSPSTNLTNFLDFDWFKLGRKEGYFIHSSDYLKKKKINLIAEFHRQLERRVDELKDEKIKLRNLIIDFADSNEGTTEKLQNRIQLCEDFIVDLHNEKVISKSGAGLVRSVLSQYECGWDQGMSDYLSDKVFLNPLKRL